QTSCLVSFSFSAPATTQIYTLSLHDALPISTFKAVRGIGMHALTACRLANTCRVEPSGFDENVFRLFRDHRVKAAHDSRQGHRLDRKSTRLNSSHRTISYAVFCLKKKKKNIE